MVNFQNHWYEYNLELSVIRDGVSKVRNDYVYPYIINITLKEYEIVKS